MPIPDRPMTKMHRRGAPPRVSAAAGRPMMPPSRIRPPGRHALQLDTLRTLSVDGTVKGLPPGLGPTRLDAIGRSGLNVLAEDLPLPLAVLHAEAIDHNSRWMRRFLTATGVSIAPHGKTTMAPQLFERQIADGAWGITLATISQAAVARRFGVPRILLANQLVGKAAIGWVLETLRGDPDFDFLAIVDSVENVAQLAAAARDKAIGRPLKLLVEGGVAGQRTGCRTVEDAVAVARAVAEAAPHLALVGVEGFEGVLARPDPREAEGPVADFLDVLGAIARACAAEGLFADGEVILSAGGSAFFDLVAERLGGALPGRESRVVIRSGCYLSHDSGMYAKAFDRIERRSGAAAGLGDGLRPALEVWAYVQSRPEPTRALLTLGKRDAAFDAGMPVPVRRFRPGTDTSPRPVGAGHAVVAMNDQHAFLDLPADSDLAVGDMVACGVSHPCLTFDRWQVIPVVDPDLTVVDAIRTFF